MESGVSILVDLTDITKGADEDAGDAGVSVSSGSVQRRVAVVVLQVGLAARHEEDAGRAIVALLAGEVQGREAALVLDVRIGLVLHQHLSRLPESLPRRFVQRSVALKFVLRVDEGAAPQQQVDNFHMSFAARQVQWREPRLVSRGESKDQDSD